MEATTKQQVKKANHSAKFKVEVNLKPSPIATSSAERARKQWHRNYNWDSVSLGTSSTSTRELLANTKYMVVDVETHDWKEQTSHSNGQIRGRIVEIAWKTFDAKGNCLDSKQYLLKPHGYNEITKKATSVHGITTKCAINHGSDAKSVFDEFTSILKLIPKDGFVVAYRMLDEDSIIMCNLSQEQKVVWDNAPKCDASSKALWTHLPPEASKKYKKWNSWRKKLGFKHAELHSIVCTTPNYCYDFVHMANADVDMTWDIFAYYKSHASYAELKWEPYRHKKSYDSVRVQHPPLQLKF